MLYVLYVEDNTYRHTTDSRKNTNQKDCKYSYKRRSLENFPTLMFTEASIVAHYYFFLAGIVLLILFLGYAFWYGHRGGIDEIEDFVSLFKKEGLSDKEIENITHDYDVWYYKNKSTCVGYSSDDGSNANSSADACPYFQEFCAGNDGHTFGSVNDQIREAVNAIKMGGTHPKCPIIYQGER